MHRPTLVLNCTTVQIIHGQCVYFFLISDNVSMIGQETTSNQLSFTLHELLRHPDIEERYEIVSYNCKFCIISV